MLTRTSDAVLCSGTCTFTRLDTAVWCVRVRPAIWVSSDRTFESTLLLQRMYRARRRALSSLSSRWSRSSSLSSASMRLLLTWLPSLSHPVARTCSRVMTSCGGVIGAIEMIGMINHRNEERGRTKS